MQKTVLPAKMLGRKVDGERKEDGSEGGIAGCFIIVLAVECREWVKGEDGD